MIGPFEGRSREPFQVADSRALLLMLNRTAKLRCQISEVLAGCGKSYCGFSVRMSFPRLPTAHDGNLIMHLLVKSGSA